MEWLRHGPIHATALVAVCLSGALAQSAATPAAPAAFQGDPQATAAVVQRLSPLDASTTAGFVATGKLTSFVKGSARIGDVTLSVWGSQHCSLTIAFPAGVRFRIVVNGRQAQVTGPSGWLDLPPAGGLAGGCDLLPQGLQAADLATGGAAASAVGLAPGLDAAAPATAQRFHLARVIAGQPDGAAARLAQASLLTLDLDATSGLPLRALYSAAGKHQVETDYSNYIQGDGVQYPTTVTKLVDGSKRLELQFATLAPRAGFTEADFALAAPAKSNAGKGGGQ